MLRKIRDKFAWAFAGLSDGLCHDRSIQLQYGFAAAGLTIGALLRFSSDEMLMVAAMCGLVIGLEYMNSALEAALDAMFDHYSPAVKKAKDLAAGAVLAACIAAAVIGIVLVLRHI